MSGEISPAKHLASSTAALLWLQLITSAALVWALLGDYDWRWWLLALGMYFLNSCLGVAVTIHRHLTHRAFDMPTWLQRIFSWFGAMGGTGSPIGWVAMHREHHAKTDEVGDPHNPRQVGLGVLASRYRFEFDGWNVRHLVTDPYHRFVHLYYHGLLLLWALLLSAIDPLVMLFGFLVPAALQINASNMLNYFCHSRGYRNYETPDHSTNNWMIALLTWGEGWHNNHHRYPHRWNLRVKWWELDPGSWIIACLRTRNPVSPD